MPAKTPLAPSLLDADAPLFKAPENGNACANSAEALSDACRLLYAPGLALDRYVGRSFAFLRQFVAAKFVMCGTLDVRTQKLTVAADRKHGNLTRAMRAFGRLMNNYPLFSWEPATNGGRPFCRSQFYTISEFRNLEIYREVFRPLEIDNHCALYVPTEPNEVMFFCIERNGGPDFSTDELKLLELIQPHLANAYNLARHFDHAAEGKVDPARFIAAGLTSREAESLSWIIQGKTNSEIALLLQISPHTVKDHVKSIFNKTGSDSRHTAVAWAKRGCRNHALTATETNPSPFVSVSLRRP